jgi:hypothetical protein
MERYIGLDAHVTPSGKLQSVDSLLASSTDLGDSPERGKRASLRSTRTPVARRRAPKTEVRCRAPSRA